MFIQKLPFQSFLFSNLVHYWGCHFYGLSRGKGKILIQHSVIEDFIESRFNMLHAGERSIITLLVLVQTIFKQKRRYIFYQNIVLNNFDNRRMTKCSRLTVWGLTVGSQVSNQSRLCSPIVYVSRFFFVCLEFRQARQ